MYFPETLYFPVDLFFGQGDSGPIMNYDHEMIRDDRRRESYLC
jgi:hypothetical protein